MKLKISFDFSKNKFYKICNIIKLSNKNLLFRIINYIYKNCCDIIECELINNEWFYLNTNSIDLNYNNIIFNEIEINNKTTIIIYGKRLIEKIKKDKILIYQ